MIVKKDDSMELAFDNTLNLLSAKWSDDLSVESLEFFQTVVSLFDTVQKKQVPNLLIDSGIPAGGVLSEELIDYFIHNIPNTPLKKIALLESPDYLWDNNLYQVILLLVTTYQLPIEVKLLKSPGAVREWLRKPRMTKSFRARRAKFIW
ncbi:hypothetical protein [Pontibacter oryzae]|uniref:STAS/SEC14 domain-containing protein n=1 Tax=Pontibacter oryzae TaxID=2304593 RepID=A0A399S2B9_9BACT|nr:hypothetical protein [Pontibacter oryzae]RIJ37448.1 hypothetical protein D1627_10005 [Pontibacter oryzae]